MGIIVKATPEFATYRNQVLGLPKKDFRALQDGKPKEIKKELYEKYPMIFQEVKNGNK